MTPAERIALSLRTMEEAVADLRAEHEFAAKQQHAREAVLVDTEIRSRVFAVRAQAAHRPRHLRPNESFGPRRQPRDGSPGPSPVDEKTQANLRLMGLAPKG